MELELFSITVLGGSGCGKTTLINAFVNNYPPAVLQETESAQLYYKTLNVTSKGGEAGAPPQPAMVEIEDTYAPTKTHGLDAYGQPRSIDMFLRLDRSTSEGEPVELLQGYEMPEVEEYRPLSNQRMAFMLVFDCSSEASLKEAEDLHSALRMDIDSTTKPVVCLVANRLDEDTTDGEHRSAAQRYAKESSISYFELSAYDLRKVKQLFRTVLGEIYSRDALWRHMQRRRKAFSRTEDIDKNEFDNEDSREAQKRVEEAEFAQRSREAAEAAVENKARTARAAQAAQEEEQRRQANEEERRRVQQEERAARHLAAKEAPEPAVLSGEEEVPYEPPVKATAVASPAPTSTGPRLHWSQAALSSTSLPPMPPPSLPPAGASSQTASEDRFGLASWLPASFFA